MQGYLTAAAEISRLAVGDRARDGARGDLSGVALDLAARAGRGRAVRHARRPGGDAHLPGRRRSTASACRSITRPPARCTATAAPRCTPPRRPSRSRSPIDGERVALLDIDRWMNSSDPDGVNLRTEPIAITAGPHTRVGGVHHPLRRAGAGPHHAARVVDRQHQHRRRLRLHDAAAPARHGDHRAVRDRPACPRRRAAARSSPASRSRRRSRLQCAHTIVTALASQAFRRTATERDVNALMALYRQGAADGGFEDGVRMALEGILASPRFVFRFEERPATARDGQAYTVSDVDLASRLSFFLWASAPDAELLRLAEAGRLSRPGEIERQVTRMLADRRADVLRLALRLAVAAAAGSRQDQPRRALLSRLRRAAEGVDAARDRDVLPSHRPQQASGARPVHRRLHLRRRAAGAALPDSRDRRRRDAPGDLSGHHAPRSARPRQHPDADLGSRAHLAGAARQVGDGGAARHAAAAAAAEHPGARRDARSRRRPDAHRARAAWSCTARTRRACRATG